MSWKPIVAGVDCSPESACAASVAADLATAAGTTCHLVHVAQDKWSALALAERTEWSDTFSEALRAQARERVERSLCGFVSPGLIPTLAVRVGNAAPVLKQVIAEQGAGLVVLGGKHHSRLERWLAGSTSIDMVRTTDVPVLVTGDNQGPIRRVLAAVDMSAATRPTIEAAERMAQMLDADLRVMCAIEPLPVVPDAPNYDLSPYASMMEDQIARRVWSLVTSPLTEKVMRYGVAGDVIVQEAADWRADLVVIGSHGKGWVDRLLIGSVTEQLLNRLPTSLLVVPVYAVLAAQDAAPQLEQQSAGA